MSMLPSPSTIFPSFDVVEIWLLYFLTLEYQFFCFVLFLLKPKIYKADQVQKVVLELHHHHHHHYHHYFGQFVTFYFSMILPLYCFVFIFLLVTYIISLFFLDKGARLKT